MGARGGDGRRRETRHGAESALPLGLVFGERHDLAKLAAGADAGLGAGLHHLSRTDASSGDESFRTFLGEGFGSLSLLARSRTVD